MLYGAIALVWPGGATYRWHVDIAPNQGWDSDHNVADGIVALFLKDNRIPVIPMARLFEWERGVSQLPSLVFDFGQSRLKLRKRRRCIVSPEMSKLIDGYCFAVSLATKVA